MPEKELTKKITKLIKDADKLVQDVEKGIKNIISSATDLKALRRKDNDGDRED